MKSMHFCQAVVAALALSSTAVQAQVKFPKAPATYDVELRYRIVADRNERIRQFDTMMDYFTKLGFKETPTEDSDLASVNPEAERMLGTIPSNRALQLFGDPRVQTVILRPPGYKDPANADEPVKVQFDLSAGIPREEQRVLSRQTAYALARLGFREAIAYDHRGFTRLRGTVPAGSLPYLFKDLRRQPQGWFLPEIPTELLEPPFARVVPVRLIEITPEPEGTPAPVAFIPPPKVDAPPAVLAKLGPALKELLANPPETPVRLELVLNTTPDPLDSSWRREIQRTVPGARIEGLSGGTVTLTVPQGIRALELARLSFVDAMFLPRAASPNPYAQPAAPMEPKEPKDKKKVEPASFRSDAADPKKEVAEPLTLTRIDRLHRLNYRGANVRVVLIDSDFTGYERFVGKRLPKNTRFIDMTTARNSAVMPDPTVTPDDAIGHGTHCALAAALAAPEADFTLVRVDPTAPQQVHAVARYVRGEAFQSEAIRTRREEIEADIGTLNRRRSEVNEQYRRAFDNFDEEEDAQKARLAAKEAVEAVTRDEKALLERINRLNSLEASLIVLKGAPIVACPLVWNSGQPLEANSPLSRYLNDSYVLPRPPVVMDAHKWTKPALWFQAAGDTRGQSWTDLFRDADNNGVMEFVPPGSQLPPERWTPELNFLSFVPAGKAAMQPDLPASGRIRVTIQWREPHDPGLAEEYYREPNAALRLILLRQRDPKGETLPTDELEPIAVSTGSAVRLVFQPNYGIYEQAIELTLPAAGRYALRIEGKVPRTLRPEGLGTLPALEQQWELRPRIFTEMVGGPAEARGRLMIGDFPSSAGGVGLPADARTAITVGAAMLNNHAEASSALGASPAAELLAKPDIWAYNEFPQLADIAGPARGSALSTAYAAGMSATLLQAGASQSHLLRSLGITPGYVFQVPSSWLPAAPKK